MRKMILATALFVVALFGFSTAASATITSPTSGSVTANGDITLRGSFINTTCAVSLTGTIASGTTVNNISGSSSGCGIGTLTFNVRNMTKTMNLDGTWRLSGVDATLSAPIVGVCSYRGHLGGTWAQGLDGVELTVTAPASSLSKYSGGSLCIGVPTVTGTVTLLGVEAS